MRCTLNQNENVAERDEPWQDAKGVESLQREEQHQDVLTSAPRTINQQKKINK